MLLWLCEDFMRTCFWLCTLDRGVCGCVRTARLCPALLPDIRLALSGPEAEPDELTGSWAGPKDPSSKSHLEFFLDSVSSFWCLGGSGFSLPSGGSRFSIVARMSSERRLRLARPWKPGRRSSSSMPRESRDLSVERDMVLAVMWLLEDNFNDQWHRLWSLQKC